MAKSRVRIPEKLRAALQQEISSTCPVCTNVDVGHFQVHHLDENPSNNAPENLLMLCANCHSKITKGDISPAEVRGIKKTLLNFAKINAARTQSSQPPAIQVGGDISHAVVGSGNVVNIRTARNPKPKYPPGCIGYDSVKANYISYLIGRYHEFKEWEIGKENMRYGWFPSQLKKHFKVGKQRTIYNLPDIKFTELCELIQYRILDTKLARTKGGKTGRFFSSFEEYAQEQGQ
jgi:hypothetical protein